MKRMLRALAWVAASLLLGWMPSAQAAFHLFRIDQVYSNSDGTIQYVVLREVTGSNGESFWANNVLSTTSVTGPSQQFRFPSNLPSTATASKSVLVATSGFAALGLVAPDYTIPAGFVPRGGGTLDYAGGTDHITLPALPADGVTAIDRNGNAVTAAPRNFAGVTATLAPAGAPDLDQHGLTGSWYQPATSGQGIELEFFPDLAGPATAFVQGAWFTFDVAPAGGAERQRWFTFSGNGQSGKPNVPVTIYQNVGGNFNAPPITTAKAVGSGTLTFAKCDAATFNYAFSDGSGRTGSIALSRLLSNVTCTTGPTPTTNTDFGLTGNWYDPTTSGQGVVVEVNPMTPFFFLTWYTYAPAGDAAGAAGQRWYTGQVSYVAGARSVTAPLFETTGGVFDAPSNPAPATVQVGSATMTFASCSSAQLQYAFTSGSNAGKSGTIALSRVGPVPPGCASASADPIDPTYPGYGGYGN